MKRVAGIIGKNLILFLLVLFMTGCGDRVQTVSELATDMNNSRIETANIENATSKSWKDLKSVKQMELKYAKQFTVDYYEEGYKLVSVKGDSSYLLIPENSNIPDELPKDIVVINLPVNDIYLVATPVMDLFRVIDGIDRIKFSGTKESGWYIPEAKEKMKQGEIIYAGKYNAPDYELLIGNNCDLAIENTMIYHNPEVKEQLERNNIPVFVDCTSYEEHPLGRLEWVKLYGVFLGCEEAAEQYFNEQISALENIMNYEKSDKSVAFFYITSNGAVVVRKPGDYVAKMIELAGGRYVFSELKSDDENALSTMKITMEDFYMAAKDADVLIYNSSIEPELDNVDELFEKNELFRDFKAVQQGRVYCTGKDMFQQTSQMGSFIEDLYHIYNDENNYEFLSMKKLN